MSFPELIASNEGVENGSIMNRQHLKTTDEDLVAEFGRVVELFGRALRTRSDVFNFCQRVNQGAAEGLTWVQALERAAEAH